MIQLKIKGSNKFKLPTYGSEYAAGIDIYSNNEEDIIISPKSRKLIPTGLQISWNDSSYYMRLAPRSGLSVKNNIDIGAGVIDYDYRGEIKVLLINNDENNEFIITKEMKIVQMIPTKIIKLNLNIVDELDDTERGEGGFGSTDSKL